MVDCPNPAVHPGDTSRVGIEDGLLCVRRTEVFPNSLNIDAARLRGLSQRSSSSHMAIGMCTEPRMNHWEAGERLIEYRRDNRGNPNIGSDVM